MKAAAPPDVRNTVWPRSEIDRFILAGLEARGIAPARPADRYTLLRRATFDLIGLPPTPKELDDFLADRSPDAFARVVDRLLASPSYGQRWGRHWLDVVRYADARDLIQLPAESDFREAWRNRDWVVSAFNRDLPYAEFVRYQLAGDLLPPTRPGRINAEGLVATGLLAIADFVPGDVDKDQMIADYVNDEIDVVGQTFLGLSLACARCHDHKFDPISTEDYYALAGIFFSTSLIPGTVPGNTPLVRVPLLPPDELARLQRDDAADGSPSPSWSSKCPTGQPCVHRPSEATHQRTDRGTSWRPANTGTAKRTRQKLPWANRPARAARGSAGPPGSIISAGSRSKRRLAVIRPSRRGDGETGRAGSLNQSAAELQHALAALATRRETESAASGRREPAS